MRYVFGFTSFALAGTIQKGHSHSETFFPPMTDWTLVFHALFSFPDDGRPDFGRHLWEKYCRDLVDGSTADTQPIFPFFFRFLFFFLFSWFVLEDYILYTYLISLTYQHHLFVSS